MIGWKVLDAHLAARGVRFGRPTAGQTTGGRHVRGSFHYRATARDYGRSNSDLVAVLRALEPAATGPGAPVVELFGLGTYYRYGRRITPSSALRRSHQDHVHAALAPNAVARFVTDWEVPVSTPPPPPPPSEYPTTAAPLFGFYPTPTGDGYWIVTMDGAVFAFGDAPFVGRVVTGR